MSENPQSDNTGASIDPRVRRTRKALTEAFAQLVLDRRYDEFRVDDIVRGAAVGRSTFYEHYRGKDELLVDSMGGLLEVLADAAAPGGDVCALEHVLAHIWEQREHARYLLAGPPARDVLPRLIRDLAARVEVRLAGRTEVRPPLLPSRLIALEVAESVFVLLRAWLGGAAPCSPAELARGMRASLAGSLGALLGEAGARERPDDPNPGRSACQPRR